MERLRDKVYMYLCYVLLVSVSVVLSVGYILAVAKALNVLLNLVAPV